MTSKPEPSECENDSIYCKFGADRLTRLLETFEGQIGGVVEGVDIEFIHRMRVASRRIRATMPLFSGCFPKKKFKKWLKQIKYVTRLLGEARDLDVQITFVEKYLSENKILARDNALELLLKICKTRRARIQASIKKGLERLRESDVLMQMKRSFGHASIEYQNPQSDAFSLREKAYSAISERIDDLLLLEPYVHQENEVLKHHQMRIKAKWLRYTMETFAPLYSNRISEEIETVKNFQDMLGEMHDCDVWIAYLPKFIKRSGGKTADTNVEPSILRFLEYVKELRKDRYASFVDRWDNCKKADFFAKLKVKTCRDFAKPEDKITDLQVKPQGEIAVLADIHANLQALEAVVEDAERRGVNTFINAGDLVGFGPFPNEVIELLHSKNVISVIGNFDVEVLEKVKKGKDESKIALEYALEQLRSSDRTYLSSLQPNFRVEIAGRRLLLTHGSPESIDEHLYKDTPTERFKTLAENAKADIIITGHSHEQYVREVEGTIFMNPGSVGRPGDGNPQAAYAIVKFKPFAVELLRVDYDVTAAADALRRKGLPESFSQMLLCGVPIDQITKEDRERREMLSRNCQEMTRNCEEISKQYWPETGHREQVRNLSLRLFDKLQDLLKLSDVERCWLECASILHDIGISVTAKAHNKKSMELILNDERLILPSEERRIIASIARYHRNGLPKRKHYNLTSLSRKIVQEITLLAGILRVADSLDYSHNGIVENLELKATPKRIVLECATSSDTTMEDLSFAKKKNLIEKALKKRMVLTWKRR